MIQIFALLVGLSGIFGMAISNTAAHLPDLSFFKKKTSPLSTLDWKVPPPMCAPFKPAAPVAAPMPWSDPATWGGNLPAAGDEVTIPAGWHVVLDMSPPPLGGLTIEGILEFDDQDLNLTSEWIMVMGELWVGTETTPFTHQAVITLNDQDPNANNMGMGTRGLLVMGGLLELHGAPPTIPWTKINAHAPAGENTLSLLEPVSWNVGDQVAIAPTDFFGAGNGASVSQRISLTAVNGTSLTLGEGLNAFRWGLLQYATAGGMSLDANGLVTPPAPSGFTPTVLDERAEVGNLTRNIVIQAPDDALWQTQNFGCHVMIMRMGTTQGAAHVNGVEIRRGGQAGRLGRYPFHWHMLSYEGTQTLPDATGQYFRNSSVNESRHRGIVIHGTNGVEVSDNVVFNVRGHGLFFEDASERRNLIDGNLIMYVRNAIQPLKVHESGERGASGFWLSNPDNTIVNNTAADCGTNGFWLAFPEHPWGLSINVPIIPRRLLFGVFDNNTAHSNRLEGIMLDNVEIDNDGNISPSQYMSTTDGQNIQWPFSTLRRFALERYKTWKNGFHGIWDRGVWPDNYEIVSADNCGRFFAGSGADGVIERSLVVGTSLNHLMNGSDRPNFTGEVPPAGFATYHSTFDIRHNIVVNFQEIANTQSGAFSTVDYYIRPVDKGQSRNVDNLLIASHTGVKLEAQFSYFALAGALWDPHDNWGGDPGEDNYYVYDTPFFTYNQTPVPVPPGSAVSGGVLVEGPFYGVNDFVVNNTNIEWEDYMAIHVERKDEDMNTVGTWSLDDAQPGWILAHMRHFAAHPDGYYTLDFPSIPVVYDVAVSVENMLTTDDTLVLGVEFSGDYDVEELYTTTWYDYMNLNHGIYRNDYTAVASFQALLASPGGTYWQDAGNNRVWVKLVGGVQQPWAPGEYPPSSDNELYRLFRLRIYGAPVRVSPKVFLEGPYNGANMNDDLRTQALIPLDQPFTALGFQHAGNGGRERMDVNAYYVTGDNALVDWVFLELRDGTNPSVVLSTRAALLQRDGDVVDMDGLSPVSFQGVMAGNYYLAVRHRNHLGVMSANTFALSATTAAADFTTIPTYGTNAQADLGGGVMGLWSGDGNTDGVINALDRNLFWRLQNGQSFNYLNSSADWNLNGSVNALDRNLFWRLNNGIIQQLP